MPSNQTCQRIGLPDSSCGSAVAISSDLYFSAGFSILWSGAISSAGWYERLPPLCAVPLFFLRHSQNPIAHTARAKTPTPTPTPIATEEVFELDDFAVGSTFDVPVADGELVDVCTNPVCEVDITSDEDAVLELPAVVDDVLPAVPATVNTSPK
ncbi:hypothetical protein EKO04_009913 [Ascochyta lentis]|uniref:Uncharacterized protein n=1 Tax=Ascochyta lentis TaxID=205686 RepID=A0A8H7IZ52_9PLEO|nr:hypothetical protein EKO04_009913 [Ascochyta lentis]